MKSTPAGAIGTLLVLLMLSSCAAPAQLSSTQPLTAAPVPSPAVTATYAPEPPPLPSPTITVTSSATHTPTDVSTFSPTATPSSTPRSTATPTATPSIPRVVILKAVNIRSGPGTNYAVVTSGKAGDEYEACGRNQAADWMQLCGYGDPQRWVYVGADLRLAEVAGSQAGQQLKLVDPIPTPPLPTNTPDPCYGATVQGARQRFGFDQIVPCLYTPAKVVAFMTANLRHFGGDWDQVTYGGNTYTPAWEVYANGTDDCDGLAEFAACVLRRNGYEAYNVGISINSSFGHNVAGFVNPKDGKVYAINNGTEIDGPFASWEELAKYFIDKGYAEAGKNLILFEPCIPEKTSPPGGPILYLPHREIWP